MADAALLERLKERRGRVGAAGYAFGLIVVVLALTGAVALLIGQPWLFPSLGPTVMLFFSSPELPSARPRDAIVGHVVGVAVGAGCLWLFGLQGAEAATTAGLTPTYVAAGVLAVAATTALLELLGLKHPPAGASTLLVALGVLTTVADLASMVGAVVLITLAGWGLNLLLGTRPRDTS